jgi:ABC-type Fe3+/spermidine/putrescine transport system ATPase subunit
MMIAGFVRPNGGTVLVDGRDIAAVPPQKRGFGMVFQNYAIFPHLNVFENIAFPLRARHWAKDRIEARVTWALELVRLNRFADRDARQLSGGQRQRVALARAIVFHPPVVLMDEPLGALDKNLRFEMQVEIKETQQRLGMTVLYVTHDQAEAMGMSDRIAIMNHGQICQVGSPGEVYERPANLFVGRFLGEANLIEGTVMAKTGELHGYGCLPAGSCAPRATATASQGAGCCSSGPSGSRLCLPRPRQATPASTRWPGMFAAARFSATSCATLWTSKALRRSRSICRTPLASRPCHVGAPVVLRWPVSDSLILACRRGLTNK